GRRRRAPQRDLGQPGDVERQRPPHRLAAGRGQRDQLEVVVAQASYQLVTPHADPAELVRIGALGRQGDVHQRPWADVRTSGAPMIDRGRAGFARRRAAWRSYRSSIRAATESMPYRSKTSMTGCRGRTPASISLASSARRARTLPSTWRARSVEIPSSAGQVVYSTGTPLARASSTDSPNVSWSEAVRLRSKADSIAVMSAW